MIHPLPRPSGSKGDIIHYFKYLTGRSMEPACGLAAGRSLKAKENTYAVSG